MITTIKAARPGATAGRRQRSGRLAALLAAFTLAVTACDSDVALCTEPSEVCPCPDEVPGDAAVVLLTDRASSAFTAAADRLAAAGTDLGSISVLGVEGSTAPVVVLATYDALGEVREQAAISLAGDGGSPRRKAADAKLRAACLRQVARTVPAEGESGDLIRALPRAMAVAAARSPQAASVVAFGLGRSNIEGQPLAEIDLDTPAARNHAISELSRVGLVGRNPMPVTVTFVDPMESIESGVAASAVDAFVSEQLCGSLTPGGACHSVLVLP